MGWQTEAGVSGLPCAPLGLSEGIVCSHVVYSNGSLAPPLPKHLLLLKISDVLLRTAAYKSDVKT